MGRPHNMARCTLILAATSLAVANAFMAPAHSGLALRSHRAASAVQPMRRSKAPQAGVSMQVEHLAEQATLLAAYPEGFINGMTSYFNLFTPIFKSLNLPPFMLHWFHALNMGTVLFAMGGYGTFLGWYMRSNPSEKMALAPGPGPRQIRVRHALDSDDGDGSHLLPRRQ